MTPFICVSEPDSGLSIGLIWSRLLSMSRLCSTPGSGRIAADRVFEIPTDDKQAEGAVEPAPDCRRDRGSEFEILFIRAEVKPAPSPEASIIGMSMRFQGSFQIIHNIDGFPLNSTPDILANVADKQIEPLVFIGKVRRIKGGSRFPINPSLRSGSINGYHHILFYGVMHTFMYLIFFFFRQPCIFISSQ